MTTTVATAARAPSGPSNVVNAKVVLLGDSAVGKSSIALRFARNEFHTNQETTIGAAFLSRTVTIPRNTGTTTTTTNESAQTNNNNNNTTTTVPSTVVPRALKFEIWDTAGQERYRSLAPIYYRGACGALVVYDITSKDSLSKAQTWIKELRANADPSLTIFLLGNKTDLNEARQVSLEEAKALAAAEKITAVYETSAKDGTHVEDAFYDLAEKLLEAGASAGAEAGGAAVRGTGGRRLDAAADAGQRPANSSTCC